MVYYLYVLFVLHAFLISETYSIFLPYYCLEFPYIVMVLLNVTKKHLKRIARVYQASPFAHFCICISYILSELDTCIKNEINLKIFSTDRLSFTHLSPQETYYQAIYNSSSPSSIFDWLNFTCCSIPNLHLHTPVVT